MMSDRNTHMCTLPVRRAQCPPQYSPYCSLLAVRREH